jgi:phytoene/squalene synthetase
MMINKELKKDYLYCKKIIEKYSKTFSIAFSMLPSPKKEAIWSLYAFNRRLDDIADKKGDIEELMAERKKFDNIFVDVVADEPIYRTLHDINMIFPIDKKAVNAMFEGQIYDINFKQFTTDEELLTYCYNVAGSVGHMILPIIATKNKEILNESSKSIGIAMQITNILRDVGEDFENNRIYLSKAQLDKYKVDLKEVFENGVNKNYIDLWESYAELAEGYYEKGLKDIELYDEDSIFIVKNSASMYSKIMDAVRQNNYNLKSKAYLTKKEKLDIILKNKSV